MRSAIWVFKSLTGLAILLANICVVLVLGRLWLVEQVVRAELDNRGLSSDFAVTRFDATGMTLSDVKLTPGAIAKSIQVQWTQEELAQQQLGVVTIQDLQLDISHSEQGWRIRDFDPLTLIPETKTPTSWQIEAIDISAARIKFEHEAGSTLAKIELRRDPTGRVEFSFTEFSGESPFSFGKLQVSQASVQGIFDDWHLQINSSGKAVVIPNLSEANLYPDGNWQFSGNWDGQADGMWAGTMKLSSQFQKTRGEAYQIASGDLNLQLQQSFLLSDPVASMKLRGKLQASLGGLNVEASKPLQILNQITPADDLAIFLQTFLHLAEPAIRRSDVELTSGFQLAKQELTLDPLETTKIAITAPDIAAEFVAVQAGWNFETGSRSIAGRGRVRLEKFSTLEFDGLTFVSDRGALETDPAQTALAIERLFLSSHAGTRNVSMQSQHLKVAGEGFTQFEVDAPRLEARWTGPLAGLQINQGRYRGGLSAVFQKGSTHIVLEPGGSRVSAKMVEVGEWTGRDFKARIDPTRRAVFAMGRDGFHLSFRVREAKGQVTKTSLDDFSVDIFGKTGSAEIDFENNGQARTSLKVAGLELDMAGVDHKQIDMVDTSIIATRRGGVWKGNIQALRAGFASQVMPVRAISKQVRASFQLNESGLRVDANKVLVDLVPIDDSGIIPPVSLVSDLHVRDGTVFGSGHSLLVQGNHLLGDVRFTHDLASGTGRFIAENQALTFASKGLQPTAFLPSMIGLVANVEGNTSYMFSGSWNQSGLANTRGAITMDGLNFDLLLGRIEGVTGQVKLSSLLPLRTEVPALVHIAIFDPGIALEAGEIRFSLDRDEYISIEQAAWPFAGGEMRLKPMQWKIGGDAQKAELVVDEIDLLELSGIVGFKDLSAEGKMSGEMPVRIEQNTMFIDHAVLTAKPPGVLRYRGQTGSDAGRAAPQAQMAFDVLENLHYSQLQMTLDGDVAGRMEAGLIVEGSNPDVLYGIPFLLRVNTSAEFAKLARQATEGMRMATTISKAIQEKNQKAD
jgi:hypothetical protein